MKLRFKMTIKAAFELERPRSKRRPARAARGRGRGGTVKTINGRVGLLLTMLGILLPHCVPLAIVGLTLTALAVGKN